MLESPLIKTLFWVNLIAMVLVAGTFLFPLPSVSSAGKTDEPDMSALTVLQRREADLKKVLERPIFHATRRTPQPRVVEKKPEVVQKVEKAPYLLAGVLGTSETSRTAYLQHEETKETISVSVGQTVGGWHVDTIGNNFVTLVLGEERQVIQLANGG
jgi:hypothetical protein